MPELPQAYPAERVVPEADGIVTLWLRGEIRYDPGQFVMVWLPGLGEKPYAVSYLEEGRFGLTVKKRGPFSTKLGALREGEYVGVRGPYGRGFRLNPRGAIVAGGVGAATVALIKTRYPHLPMLFGVCKAAEVHYDKRFPDLRVFTEDGSAGTKGFPTDALPAILDSGEVDVVYACGPEAMLLQAFRICEEYGVECQASLERYMKCGIGVCGQCVCDSLLVCKDGPVFPSAALRQMKDFGRTALLKDGTRAAIGDYLEARKKPEPASHEPVP